MVGTEAPVGPLQPGLGSSRGECSGGSSGTQCLLQRSERWLEMPEDEATVTEARVRVTEFPEFSKEQYPST